MQGTCIIYSRQKINFIHLYHYKSRYLNNQNIIDFQLDGNKAGCDIYILGWEINSYQRDAKVIMKIARSVVDNIQVSRSTLSSKQLRLW